MKSKTRHYAATRSRTEAEAAAWALAQRLGTFGYSEIAAELSTTMAVATRMVGNWLAEGRIRLCGTKGHRKQFELTEPPAAPTDRASLVAAQLWTGMRGLRTFSPVDLAAHCREDLRVDLVETRAYAQILLRAGYLEVRQTAVPGQREAVYKLIRNTGPQPPRVRRVLAIWDPNEEGFTLAGSDGQEAGQ